MNKEIETDHQRFPPHLARACEWLSAAERFDADPADPLAILSVIAASEALDALTDVSPPYPALVEQYEPAPLAAVMPAIRSTLELASAEAGDHVQALLRIARAARILVDHARAAEAGL